MTDTLSWRPWPDDLPDAQGQAAELDGLWLEVQPGRGRSVSETEPAWRWWVAVAGSEGDEGDEGELAYGDAPDRDKARADAEAAFNGMQLAKRLGPVSAVALVRMLRPDSYDAVHEAIRLWDEIDYHPASESAGCSCCQVRRFYNYLLDDECPTCGHRFSRHGS